MPFVYLLLQMPEISREARSTEEHRLSASRALKVLNFCKSTWSHRTHATSISLTRSVLPFPYSLQEISGCTTTGAQP